MLYTTKTYLKPVVMLHLLPNKALRYGLNTCFKIQFTVSLCLCLIWASIFFSIRGFAKLSLLRLLKDVTGIY